MQLTDLGFVFLLLPAAALGYTLLPQRRRAAGLAALSAGFLLLMEPRIAGWLMASVALDAAVSRAMGAQKLSPRAGALLCWAAVGKNLLLLLWFGLIVPMRQGVPAPVGVWVVTLSAVDLLLRRRAGKLPALPFSVQASQLLFFGRLPFGPVGVGARALGQLSLPVFSLSTTGRGVMRLVLGLFKRVVLAEQLDALCRTLVRLPEGQMTVALGWFAAAASALRLYYILSAYSDIAVGIGRIFGLELPALVHYPFQAKGFSELIRRWNTPLSAVAVRLGRQLHLPAHRMTAAGALLLAAWVSPTWLGLLWGALLMVLALPGAGLFGQAPPRWRWLSRILTALVALPGYLLLLPVDGGWVWALWATMFGARGAPAFNNATLYLLTSWSALLSLALAGCWSLPGHLLRRLEQRLPSLWWPLATALTGLLLVVTTSFLLWNVR